MAFRISEYLKTHHISERLTARLLNANDINPWTAYFENNPNLRFFNLETNADNDIHAKQWLERQFRRYDNNGFGLLALDMGPEAVLTGMCGLLLQEIDGNTEIEVGYHIIPKFWRQGIATEAARYFKQFAFDNNISDTLISIIHEENTGSQKVAMNNGMQIGKRLIYHGHPVNIFRINK